MIWFHTGPTACLSTYILGIPHSVTRANVVLSCLAVTRDGSVVSKTPRRINDPYPRLLVCAENISAIETSSKPRDFSPAPPFSGVFICSLLQPGNSPLKPYINRLHIFRPLAPYQHGQNYQVFFLTLRRIFVTTPTPPKHAGCSNLGCLPMAILKSEPS